MKVPTSNWLELKKSSEKKYNMLEKKNPGERTISSVPFFRLILSQNRLRFAPSLHSELVF